MSQTPSAPPQLVQDVYRRRLSLETDCWDVYESMRTGMQDFVLLDVRGRQLYEKAHVPGALNLPHRQMAESQLARWRTDTLFVVYCAGPHCNGADRAALRLAQLGRRVKVMIGGMTGWADEGFGFASGAEPDRRARTNDAVGVPLPHHATE